jgi:hypothetical protein
MKTKTLVLFSLFTVGAIVVIANGLPERKPEPRSDLWVDDDGIKRAYTTLIQVAGYNCPDVKLIHKEGPDAYGNVVKVWCGPAGQSGVYEKLVFRVTWPTQGEIKLPRIQPW